MKTHPTSLIYLVLHDDADTIQSVSDAGINGLTCFRILLTNFIEARKKLFGFIHQLGNLVPAQLKPKIKCNRTLAARTSMVLSS